MTCFLIDGKTVKKYCEENGLRYDRFYYWMEKGLSVEESIEKIKTNNHHNRKWVYNGESIFIYCKRNNLLYNSVIKSIKNGMSVEDAIEKSRRLKNKKGRPAKIQYNGESVRKYCEGNNLFYQTIYHRLRSGMNIEKAITRRRYVRNW